MAIMNALKRRRANVEIKRTGGAHGHTAGMRPLVTPTRHHRTNEVPGPKALHHFVAHELPTRKPVRSDPCPLIGPAPARSNSKRRAPPL